MHFGRPLARRCRQLVGSIPGTIFVLPRLLDIFFFRHDKEEEPREHKFEMRCEWKVYIIRK